MTGLRRRNRFGSYVLELAKRGFESALLQLRSLLSKKPVTGTVPVDVSLTTHGVRISQVHLTLESIARGSALPRSVTLYLSRTIESQPLSRGLDRLLRRGLQLRYVEDVGPHTKYYPHVISQPLDAPLVTADDDLVYPKSWLEDLYVAHCERPDVITAHRAHLFGIDASGAPQRYSSWLPVGDTCARLRNFGTGVGGVMYPPGFLKKLREAGDDFLVRCAKADDVWIHAVAVKNGYKTRQVSARPLKIESVPGTQRTNLNQQNVGGLGLNDQYIDALYDRLDLDLMRAEDG